MSISEKRFAAEVSCAQQPPQGQQARHATLTTGQEDEGPSTSGLSSSTMAPDEGHPLHLITVYMFAFNPPKAKDNESQERVTLQFHKRSTAEELIEKIIEMKKDEFNEQSKEDFELYETLGTLDGRTFKERKLDPGEYPVVVQTLWPKCPILAEDDLSIPRNRFVLRRKGMRSIGAQNGSASASTIDSFLAKFLAQPQDREYADLCMLPELTEQTLLDNLRDRFNSGHIYTYIGPILVAVNPFQFFPIYNPKYSSLYCQIQSRLLGALPPHIFAIADITYHSMMRTKKPQCVVISGESGSGKTESTNFLLHHLTTISQKGTMGSTIEQILSAGPVLEAFGNAVTVQNNNSSRFGKFIKVNYRENGMVFGASVEFYLLEKSRIISQAIGERNYHVFYYLLEGASDEERQRHFLLEPKDYYYLNQNSFFACESMNEKHEYQRLKRAMETMGFSHDAKQKCFRMISAVLLLGNIEFIKRPGYHSDENAFVEKEELVDRISGLLHIKSQQLAQALTMRITRLKHDTVVARYTRSEAIQTRDAMAKCLYNALFQWIVLRINQSLIRKEAAGGKALFIGILDIFGFEDVGAQWNSFEQLCINYANERLQAYFNQHIFQFEQEEYIKEEIAWQPIAYTDNTECVQLFQSKPYGLLRLVDEESNINNGTDQSMLDKLNKFLKSNDYYEVPHKREAAFIIAHYAGKVKYQIHGFREKNKDTMRQDVLSVLKSSKSAFIKELIGYDAVAVFRWALVRATFRAMFAFRQAGRRSKRSGSVDRLKLLEGPRGNQMLRGSSDSHLNAFLRGDLGEEVVPEFCDTSVFKTIFERAKKTPTKPHMDRPGQLRSLQAVREVVGKNKVSNKPSSVSRQFGESLSRLMKTLAQATPYFIRCIKSNNEKIPNFFDDNIILRQLRYTGMLETVRIRRAGYSVRIEYKDFISQYRILLPAALNSTHEDIKHFIHGHPLIDRNNFQFGKSKVFMRDAEKLLLDDQLHKNIIEKIVTIQRWFVAVLIRRRFLKLKNGVIKLQANVRGMLVRNELHRHSIAVICIQSWWRMAVVRRKYAQIQRTILALQAIARGNAQRKNLENIRTEKGGKKPRTVIDIRKITKVQTINLTKFDLNDPSTFAAYGSPDDSAFGGFDSEATDEDDLSSPIDEDDEERDDVVDEYLLSDAKAGSSDIDLDASFTIDNDARLKLIESATGDDKQVIRRQSLAVATSSERMRMARRAASTDSRREEGGGAAAGTDSATFVTPVPSVSKMCKTGLSKAKRQLKALLTRKSSDSRSKFSPESGSIPSKKQSTFSMRIPTKPDVVEKLREHNFKMARVYKENCALCNRPVGRTLLAQGLKCYACKMTFHKDCAGFATKIPCTSPMVSPVREQHFRRPWDSLRKPRASIAAINTTAAGSEEQQSSSSSAQLGTFNLTKTQQQVDSNVIMIETTEDLREFSVFIFKKQAGLNESKQNRRETVVDAVFKRSLKEFHMELIGTEAVLTEEKTVLKYRDLIRIFEGLLTKMCNEEMVTFPTTLGVNAFRGFLNEFMQLRSKRRGSNKKSKIMSVKYKRRRSDVTLHNGHRFNPGLVHIPTYCECCNLFMWHAEKICICLNCRMSCHKKCHTKVAMPCPKALKTDNDGSSQFFGADLANLIDENHMVPLLLDRLLMSVEVRALFVEGIYRKSGALAAIKATRKAIETADDHDKLDLDDVPVHVLASLVKSFFRFSSAQNFLSNANTKENFRELTEPIITYELYDNFVNISEIKETNERIRCLRAIMEMLPKGNKSVLDRLIYHLARVAHQESVNKMSASNLAVIFAPCIVRRNHPVHAQEQLQDVAKQAICVQTLIEDKLRQCQETMTQIVELETASEKVSENLRRIEEHRLSSASSISTSKTLTVAAPAPATPKNIETARQLFEEQLDFLFKEKAKLISELPPLAPVASSEDLSSSDGAENQTLRRNSGGSTVSKEEYALDLRSPLVLNRLPNQEHLKDRAKGRDRIRPPTQSFIDIWKKAVTIANV